MRRLTKNDLSCEVAYYIFRELAVKLEIVQQRVIRAERRTVNSINGIFSFSLVELLQKIPSWIAKNMKTCIGVGMAYWWL